MTEAMDASSDLIDTLALATNPVLCTHCGAWYDLVRIRPVIEGEVYYWKAPCCDAEADDRGYLSRPAFRRLLYLQRDPPGIILRPIKTRLL